MSLNEWETVTLDDYDGTVKVPSADYLLYMAVREVVNILYEALNTAIQELDEAALHGNLIIPLPNMQAGFRIAYFDEELDLWVIPDFRMPAMEEKTTTIEIFIAGLRFVFYVIDFSINIDLKWLWKWVLKLPDITNPAITDYDGLWWKINNVWTPNTSLDPKLPYRAGHLATDVTIAALIVLIVNTLCHYGLAAISEKFQKLLTNAGNMKSVTNAAKMAKNVDSIKVDTSAIKTEVKEDDVYSLKEEVLVNKSQITQVVTKLSGLVEKLVPSESEDIMTLLRDLKNIIGLRLLVR